VKLETSSSKSRGQFVNFKAHHVFTKGETGHFKFGIPSDFDEISIYCTHNRGERRVYCVGSCNLLKYWQISANILHMVQYTVDTYIQ